MGFKLDGVVPWGRSFDEYRRMFQLTDADLMREMLGCADGPAAFNANLTRRGGKIVSCDPIYQLSATQIHQRIDECFPNVLEQAAENADCFVWSPAIPDVQSLGRIRRQAMNEFLDDFPTGKNAGRYVCAELPSLPFAKRQFDLALCSHFLFLYESLGSEFHRESLAELTRVATEVRIFPIVQLDGSTSTLVFPLIEQLSSALLKADLVAVEYEFQQGANQMLKLRRTA